MDSVKSVLIPPRSVLESIPVDYDAVADGTAISDEDQLLDHENNSSGEQLIGLDEAAQTTGREGAEQAPGAKPVANVDSECDSDDEWNYVKQPETAAAGEEQPVQHEEIATGDDQEVEKEAIVEESEKLQEQQYAEAQAIAEAQEHCAEVSVHCFGIRGGHCRWSALGTTRESKHVLRGLRSSEIPQLVPLAG